LSETASAAFGKEKVIEKARTHLDILSSLLRDKTYFFGNEPSSLDAIVAAHILLLMVPPLPNDLLRVFITSNYPTLCAHAQRLRYLIQGEESPSLSQSLSLSTPYASEFDLQNAVAQPQMRSFVPLTVRSAPRTSLSAFTSVFSTWRSSSKGAASSEGKSDEEKKYDRLRWGFYALAVGSVFAWGAMSGLRIVFAGAADDDVQEQSQEMGDGEHEEDEDDEEEVVEIEVEDDAEDDSSE